MSSKGLPPIGPGAASLAAGIAWAEFDSKARKDIARLEEELELERERLCRALAGESANLDLANQMVRELKAEAEGQRGVRRLSDPANKELRHAHRVLKTDEELRRLSDGRLSLKSIDVNAARTVTRKAKP
jgi:hypothetical protein